MEAWLLSLAASIAAAASAWPKQKIQQMEASRECCRVICIYLGMTPDTECLANLWVAMTAATVKMSDINAGDDIDAKSMGLLPFPPKEFEDLKHLNLYQKNSWHKTWKFLLLSCRFYRILIPAWYGKHPWLLGTSNG